VTVGCKKEEDEMGAVDVVVMVMLFCGLVILTKRILDVQASQKALEEDPETWMRERELEKQYRRKR
jgi:hypothetical protein